MKTPSRLFVFVALLWVCRPAWCAVEYSAEGSRDPFFEDGADSAPVSSAPAAGAAEPWVLDGILWSPGSSIARVNGQKVAAGDRLGDVEIVRVDKKGVLLKRGGKEGYLTKEGIRWT